MCTVKQPHNNWIDADWPAPAHVRAGTTTRSGGVSLPPFNGFNLAGHVGDEADAVAENRLQLRTQFNLPAQPLWLRQQHGNKVITAGTEQPGPADGAYANAGGKVCAVLTADCIPLLLCNRNGTEVAALHIGWRGLCRRIIKHGLSAFDAAPPELCAWIGPHISRENYEVGADVVSACASIWDETRFAITPGRAGHWYLDLGQLVRTELLQLGVTDISDCKQCTCANKEKFYSYRRDGVTGRMASLIWIE